MTDSHGWRSTLIAFNSDIELPMGELVDGWDAHVRRIVAELDAKPGDRTTWGAYDLVAALHLREAIEDGLQALELPVRRAVMNEVAAIDQAFSTNTEEDHGALLAAFVGAVQPSVDAWWWHRIPARGPIRVELTSTDASA